MGKWNNSSKIRIRTCLKHTVQFELGRTWSGRGPENTKDDFFIPNLVHLLIQIIIIGEMAHCHISKMSLD